MSADKFLEVKKEYDAFASLVNADISTYYTAAVLKIWSGNQYYSPDYSELLNTVTYVTYTSDQILTAMKCCDRDLLIPEFIKKTG